MLYVNRISLKEHWREGCICLSVEFKYQQAFSRITDYTFNSNKNNGHHVMFLNSQEITTYFLDKACVTASNMLPWILTMQHSYKESVYSPNPQMCCVFFFYFSLCRLFMISYLNCNIIFFHVTNHTYIYCYLQITVISGSKSWCAV